MVGRTRADDTRHRGAEPLCDNRVRRAPSYFPVECERLQSFPDGWTEPAGSDSARYKAMGNAVTVNVVRWILGRLP
jgi:DNA (cytosine-5)-methyltransferase 1